MRLLFHTHYWAIDTATIFQNTYTNDIALLLAEKPDSQGEFGHARLIVDQGAGLAMDISNDLLKIATEQNHVDFARALKATYPLTLNETNGAIKIFF